MFNTNHRNIFIKDLSGNTYTIDVIPTQENMESISQKVFEASGIPVEQQRLYPGSCRGLLTNENLFETLMARDNESILRLLPKRVSSNDSINDTTSANQLIS